MICVIFPLFGRVYDMGALLALPMYKPALLCLSLYSLLFSLFFNVHDFSCVVLPDVYIELLVSTFFELMFHVLLI